MRVRTIFALVTAILLLAVGSTTHFARRGTVEKTTRPLTTITSPRLPISPQENAKATDEASSDIQVVLIALRPEGFEPTELQLPAGEYLLVIRNRSGLDQIKVRLLRGTNDQVALAEVGARLKDWKERVKLTPGTYLLTESDHPDWTCRIVVER